MLTLLQLTHSSFVDATKAAMRDSPGARQIVTIGEFGCTSIMSNFSALKQRVRMMVPETSGSIAYGAVYYGLHWCTPQGTNDTVHVPPASGTTHDTVPLAASTATSTAAEQGEEDGANSSVNVPPSPGTSDGTVPPVCTAVPNTADEGEEEWANDPVYVPPSPLTSQGTVPPVCTAVPNTADEGEEEWANDPVLPPSPGTSQGSVPPSLPLQ
jgi:hypothetical protein